MEKCSENTEADCSQRCPGRPRRTVTGDAVDLGPTRNSTNLINTLAPVKGVQASWNCHVQVLLSDFNVL
jgi:hypothetical protein